jgi:hypothetical protein
MRTTIHLPDDLFAKYKRLSVETHRTLTAVIEEALRESVSRRAVRKAPRPVRLTTFRGNGLQPGVDIDDSAALLDLLDEIGAPARR